MPHDVSDFDYQLDPQLIAQAPLAQRSASRLLVLERSTGRRWHSVFQRLGQLLHPGDLLVVNDTRVVPAKFFARRKTGGKLDGLFLAEDQPGRWQVLLKGAGKCRRGERIELEGSDAQLVLRENLGEGRWQVGLDPAQPAERLLERIGATPLPPYIRRPGPMGDGEDRQRYQTVYASRPGAVAAPTAGLHFTQGVLGELAGAGVQIARLTLHVGLGTFAPVKVEDLRKHKMHAEWYELPAQTADKLNAASREGRRIIAVGTTTVRVLETVAAAGAAFEPTSGWTDIFIYPPAEFKAVDALVTNFHLPRSTLLMLVAAFCSPGDTAGIKMILDAYAEAVRHGYRFYSYGDAMLIL